MSRTREEVVSLTTTAIKNGYCHLDGAEGESPMLCSTIEATLS